MSDALWIAGGVIVIGVPWFYGALMIFAGATDRVEAWRQRRRRRRDNARSGVIRFPVPPVQTKRGRR